MGEIGNFVSRRGFVRGFLLGVTGVLGLGGASRLSAAESGRPAPAGAVDAAAIETGTVLHARYVNFGAQSQPVGAASSNEPIAVTGELLDQPDGNAIGSFHASGNMSTSVSWSAGVNTLLLSTSTFLLADGSIFAVGSIRGEIGEFAIVGGTGPYLGMQGSITAQIAAAQGGGDNTATFTFKLVGRQVFLPGVMRQSSNGY